MTVAVLLAAGKSDFHDGLLSHVEVGGQRLIDLQVACLRTSGAEDVVVVAGHEAKSLDRADIVLVHNPEWSGTGSITSLQRAAHLFDGKNDIVVGYGDTIFDPEVLRALYRSPGPISCACLLDRSGQDVNAYREFAQIEDGELKAVSPTAQAKGLRTVFCGLLFVRAGVAEAVGRYLNERVCPPSAHVGEFVNAMLAHGTAVTPVIIEHGWAEITNAANYTRLLNNQRLLDVVLPVHTDWTRRSVRYDQLQWVNSDALMGAITDLARDWAPRTVLDVGTGTGKVLLAIKAVLGGGEFWGLDYSEAMLGKIEAVEGLTLVCEDAEAMTQVPRAKFDLATARMIFHHLRDPAAVLRRVREALRPGGRLMICEGVPPSLDTVPWYTEMFRYKEDRTTLTEVDLIRLLVDAGFEDIVTNTVILRDASLNNWIDNADLPEENVRKIKEMHWEAPEYVRRAYGMRFEDGDCLMTWRFAVTWGTSPGPLT